MQAETEAVVWEDPLSILRWNNVLDDIGNAHTRIDEHIERSDEWLRDFEAQMGTHGKLAMEMYHTVTELRGIVEHQQRQIEELQAIVNYCHNRHPSEAIAIRAIG